MYLHIAVLSKHFISSYVALVFASTSFIYLQAVSEFRNFSYYYYHFGRKQTHEYCVVICEL